MDTKQVSSYFTSLSKSNQDNLLKDLNRIKIESDYSKLLQLRGDALDDKRAECPHCQGSNYYKNGKDKGCRKYKCKDCKLVFTEYTGTWINGIHKKHLIPDFMKTLESNLSLIKSSKKIGLNAGTIFKWRHKFLSLQESVEEQKPFKGITEVDETFYLHSQKGNKCKHRAPRKRGGGPSKGITNQEAVVLTIMDREGNSEYRFTNMCRISADELEQAIGDRTSKRTILCSDGHNSYKSFTKKQNIEHHILNASKGERVKGGYHIQHINSLHSRMKSFFNYNLKGVSTKYIQKYLNWQKIKDMFSDSPQWIKTISWLFLLMGVGVSEMYSQNLITNSNFDTGGNSTFALSPWYTVGAQAGVYETDKSTSKPKAVRLSGGGSIKQIVTGLISNTSYRFSCWVYTSGASKIAIGAKNYLTSTTGEVTKLNVNSGYELVSVDFTTGSSSTSATVYFYTNQSTVYGDDFSLRKLPLPADLYVVDGTFESGNLNAWHTSSFSFFPTRGRGNVEITSTASEVYGGTKAVKLSGRAGLSISQSELGLKAGVFYNLKAWTKVSRRHARLGTTQATLSIQNFTDGIVNTTQSANTTSSSYEQLSITFTTGASPFGASLSFKTRGSGTAFIDNITITEVRALDPTDESTVSKETMLSNPERGFRFEQIVKLPDLNNPWYLSQIYDLDNILSDWETKRDATDGHVRLSQWYVYLSGYKDSALPQQVLYSLQRCFEVFRTNGYKMLLRFVYQAPESQAPYRNIIPTASRIIGHLDQLRPLLETNKDVIHVYQMGLIGAWGEWHSYGRAYSQKDKNNIVAKVLEVLPAERQVQMRDIRDRKKISTSSVSNTIKDSRIGFHNDFFGDSNTYASTSSGYYGSGTYNTVKDKSPYLIVDGESGWSRDCNDSDTCVWQVSELFDVYPVLVQFLDHHYTSYSLEHGYHANNAYWKRFLLSKEKFDALHIPYHSEFFTDNNGAATSRTAYEYIRDHLGYRLYSKPANDSYSYTKNGNSFSYTINIENYGFSAIHNPREVYVVVLDGSNNVIASELTSADLSNWQPYIPGDASRITLRHSFTGTLDLPALSAASNYKIGLWLPDPILKNNKKYDILLANRTGLIRVENVTQKINVIKDNISLGWNHAPVITYQDGVSEFDLDLNENTQNVATITATDVDADTTLAYSLSQHDSGVYDITESGVLTFKADYIPNYEMPRDDRNGLRANGNQGYWTLVTVSDGSLTDEILIKVTIQDVNEAPTLADATFELPENSINGASVGNIGQDPDTTAPNNTLTYSITGGNTNDAFAISNTGAITVNGDDKIDFETTEIYILTVRVADGGTTRSLIDTATITINVTNGNLYN